MVGGHVFVQGYGPMPLAVHALPPAQPAASSTAGLMYQYPSVVAAQPAQMSAAAAPSVVVHEVAAAAPAAAPAAPAEMGAAADRLFPPLSSIGTFARLLESMEFGVPGGGLPYNQREKIRGRRRRKGRVAGHGVLAKQMVSGGQN